MAVLAHLLALAVVVVVPVLSLRRYRELSAPETEPPRRLRLLTESIVVKGLLVPPLFILWLRAGPSTVSWWGTPGRRWLGVLMVAGAVASAVLVARRVRTEGQREDLARAVENVVALLPRSRRERQIFALAAVTAGVTEELAYRAFLIAYLAWLLPAGWTTAVVVAAVIFGLVHLYQGPRGIVLTGLLGLVFGLAYAEVGLVALMVVHTIVDARVLLLPVGLAVRPRHPQAEA